MKFTQIFFASAVLACLAYYSSVLLLINSHIPSEYWVGEMIAVKNELAKEYAGRRKIIIAGGSSTLFGIDAEYASKKLEMPVINFGLHAGLQLRKIIQEVNSVVNQGDLIVFQLEPKYYSNEKLTTWDVENIIGWDHDTWIKMDFAEKAKFITSVSPTIFFNMLVAEIQMKYYPESINDRIISLDNSFVLSKFRTRAMPFFFEYSAYHLDNYGDMLRAEGASFKGIGENIKYPDHLGDKSKSQLVSFISSMKKMGVQVYFANTPYISYGISKEDIRNSERNFQNEFSSVGCFIDKREDLVFDRKYFFNTDKHLNTEGCAVRTDLFINSIRNNVFSGFCDQPRRR